MTPYDTPAAFKTLLNHFEAHPFDLRETLQHLQDMARHTPDLGTFLNEQSVHFPSVITSGSKHIRIEGRTHTFFLMPYLVALYEFHHLDTPYRSFLNDDVPPPSGSGFNFSDLLQMMDALISVGVDVNRTFDQDDSALHLAAQSNDLLLVSALMERGADPTLTNALGQSPVHVAVYRNQLELVRLFLTLGISPDFRADPSWQYSYPLIITALHGGHVPMLDLLHEYRVSLSRDPHSNVPLTPLMAAVTNYYANPDEPLPLITWLLEHGANVNEKDLHGRIALHMAASHDRMNITELLLKHGAHIFLQDAEGNTPLHVAVQRGSMDHVLLFMTLGSDLEVLNHQGETPWDVAKNTDHYQDPQMLALLGSGAQALQEKNMLTQLLPSLSKPMAPSSGESQQSPPKKKHSL